MWKANPIAARTCIGLPAGRRSGLWRNDRPRVPGFIAGPAWTAVLCGAPVDTVIQRLDLAPVSAVEETAVQGFRRRVGWRSRSCTTRPSDPGRADRRMDPNQKHEVRTLINRDVPRQDHRDFHSHPEEVDAVCTRAMVIARGRLVADDTPAGWRGVRATTMRCRFSWSGPNSWPPRARPVALCRRWPAVEVDERGGKLTALPADGRRILGRSATGSRSRRTRWSRCASAGRWTKCSRT